MNEMRPRVCGAVVRGGDILMVRHCHGGREYWTLPGGGVEAGETPEQAVTREVREETGLDAEVDRFLFDEPYLNGTSICRCFLLREPVRGPDDSDAPPPEIRLGFDPEEAHLAPAERQLQDVAWHSLDRMRNDGQVAKVLEALGPLA